MKRLLPVLFGAVGGAIGLSVVMSLCGGMAHALLPQFFPQYLNWPQHSFVPGLSTGRGSIVLGFALGASSWVLWRGTRTIWSRLGSALCGAFTLTFFVNQLLNGLVGSGGSINPAFWSDFAFFLPPFIWSSALFFFAVLARRRNGVQ